MCWVLAKEQDSHAGRMTGARENRNCPHHVHTLAARCLVNHYNLTSGFRRSPARVRKEFSQFTFGQLHSGNFFFQPSSDTKHQILATAGIRPQDEMNQCSKEVQRILSPRWLADAPMLRLTLITHYGIRKEFSPRSDWQEPWNFLAFLCSIEH